MGNEKLVAEKERVKKHAERGVRRKQKRGSRKDVARRKPKEPKEEDKYIIISLVIIYAR